MSVQSITKTLAYSLHEATAGFLAGSVIGPNQTDPDNDVPGEQNRAILNKARGGLNDSKMVPVRASQAPSSPL